MTTSALVLGRSRKGYHCVQPKGLHSLETRCFAPCIKCSCQFVLAKCVWSAGTTESDKTCKMPNEHVTGDHSNDTRSTAESSLAHRPSQLGLLLAQHGLVAPSVPQYVTRLVRSRTGPSILAGKQGPRLKPLLPKSIPSSSTDTTPDVEPRLTHIPDFNAEDNTRSIWNDTLQHQLDIAIAESDISKC